MHDSILHCDDYETTNYYADELHTSTLAIVPRERPKMAQITLSVPVDSLPMLTTVFGALAHELAMQNPESATYIAHQIYQATDDGSRPILDIMLNGVDRKAG